MNEDEYRSIYQEVNPQRCVFEKITLLRYGNCEYNKKLLLAEREAMACQSEGAQANCLKLLNMMRQNARFTLQITQANAPLPHSQELRVQAGGLYGLQQFLNNKDTADTEELNNDKLKYDDLLSSPIKNIHKIVAEALLRFIRIKDFPYNEIVKAIIHFSPPSRKKKRDST